MNILLSKVKLIIKYIVVQDQYEQITTNFIQFIVHIKQKEEVCIRNINSRNENFINLHGIIFIPNLINFILHFEKFKLKARLRIP